MSCTVLLVEDDDTFGAVLGRSLVRRGYNVSLATSAKQALELAMRVRPTYAIVDLKLPGDSGLVVVSRLKAALPRTRTIVLTGYASIATAVEAIKLGAVHYLAKPADADQILEALCREAGDAHVPLADPPSLARLEWEHIQRVLAEHGGNISATARALKMHRRTLQRKLAKKPIRM
ncbi:MAG TPA: response regulator transcription factor [Burkholderiales bacterium]|jgi:two-component system response regulator RegA|nr:response regulator transcription factor [Burkholderiales bacterium]